MNYLQGIWAVINIILLLIKIKQIDMNQLKLQLNSCLWFSFSKTYEASEVLHIALASYIPSNLLTRQCTYCTTNEAYIFFEILFLALALF